MAHEDKTSPWKLGGLSVSELGRRVWKEINEDEILTRAAALSYYILFAFFPGLLFLTAFLSLLQVRGALGLLMRSLGQVLPGDSLSLIRQTLHEARQASHFSLLSIGAVAALWSASSGMASVMAALNVAYHASDPRPWWQRRGVALLLTLGFSVLLVAALLLMVFGPKLEAILSTHWELGSAGQVFLKILSVAVPVCFVLFGIALVYFFAPSVEQSWHWVTPGSVLGTCLWLVFSLALRLYVHEFSNYNATYGSLGGVILLMLWLYLTGIVLLLGAEVNSEIENAAAQRMGERAAAA